MQPINFDKTFILLPCHSFEDFPLHHIGEKADGLLGNWIAMWHPQLIAQTKSLPQWNRADEPPDNLASTAVFIPDVSNSWLPTGFAGRAARQGATLITGESSRWSILERILPADQLQQDNPNVADWFALGYAFLQVKLMTHQLRSSSNLDEDDFQAALCSAATAFIDQSSAEDPEHASLHLTRCFDLLLEEKDNYYPVQPELIDLVLMADTTMGSSLQRQLQQRHPRTLLATGQLVQKLKTNHHQTFENLKQQVVSKRIDIIAPAFEELPTGLLSPESIIHQLVVGAAFSEKELGVQQTIFAQRQFGLSSSIPAILDQLGFAGALHASFDDSTIPLTSASNIRWEGEEGGAVLGLGQTPKDAQQAATFLNLGVDIGQAIDSAHVATVVLAHWPGRTHECMNDVIRIQKFGPLLGAFVKLSDYFDEAYDPGYSDNFTADEYQSRLFKQMVRDGSTDPVSRFVRYWRRLGKLQSLRSTSVMIACLLKKLKLNNDVIESFQDKVDDLQMLVELDVLKNSNSEPETEIDTELDAKQELLLSCLDKSSLNQSSSDNNSAQLLINCGNLVRRIHTQFPASQQSSWSLKSLGHVQLAEGQGGLAEWIVDTPAMSFIGVSDQQAQNTNSNSLKGDASVLQENSLRNEYFELVVDAESGGIRNLNCHDRRKNLLGQKLALRLPGHAVSPAQASSNAGYTTMKCSRITGRELSRLTAEIVTEGHLLDGEQIVAEYKQTVGLTRGMRHFLVSIELNPKVELSASSRHYFCSRLAWHDESAELIRSAGHVRSYASGESIEAASFVEIISPQQQLTLFPCGLPFHQRSAKRMLDTVLIAGGERETKFEFSIGVNLPYGLPSALDMIRPVMPRPMNRLKPEIVNGLMGSASFTPPSWMFHFNCKNVVATWWKPVYESGEFSGVEVRLRETQGRAGQLTIISPFELGSAERVGFNSVPICVEEFELDRAIYNFSAFEYFQLRLNWKP